MLSPLILIPAFLGTAIYAVAIPTTTPVPTFTITTFTTISPVACLTTVVPCLTAPAAEETVTTTTTAAPPLLAGRAETSSRPPFNPFSIPPIPPIPGFSVPSSRTRSTPRSGPSSLSSSLSCPFRYVCYVECRIGIVTPACKGCCDDQKKPEEPKKAEGGAPEG
ncbi:hypothetical protein PG994_012715 [Apiospora phragmitis]|uniref:Uncharacterized protein n=1 Tax=Apiospora phragmitis TaxID=2905665 RepID=A0ABR1TB81_9PEZI